MASPLLIANGAVIPRARIPRIDFPHFLRELTDFVHCNGYIVQLFAYAEADRTRLLPGVFCALCAEFLRGCYKLRVVLLYMDILISIFIY